MTLFREAWYAIRLFARHPGFATVAVSTLAVGIGMSIAVWSVVDAVLIDPLPYPDSHRLVEVRTIDPGHHGHGFPATSPDYREWAEQNRSLEAMAATFRENLSLTGGSSPERVRGTWVSAAFFDVVGLAPTIGRPFTATDDRPGADLVAVLSHALWQRRFHGDPGVLGGKIVIDGRPYTVVGVTPEAFSFPGDTELWLPIAFDWSQEDRGRGYITAFGRIREGFTIDEVQADFDRIAAWQSREYPDFNAGQTVRVFPAKELVIGDIGPVLWVLLAAVSGVLLIAASNVSILLGVRTIARGREVALRQALGAGRPRLARQLITESTILALVAGSAGVLLAHWVVVWVGSTFADLIPRSRELGLDNGVLLVALALSAIVGLVVGAAGAARTPEARIMNRLRESDRNVAGGRSRVGTALLTAEISLAVALLGAAALLIRTSLNLLEVDPGFDSDHVLTAEIALTGDRYADGPERVSLFSRAITKIESLPGVQAVATVYPLPLYGRRISTYPYVEGRPGAEMEVRTLVDQRFVSPGYLDVLGIDLLAGRWIAPSDTADAPSVVVVNTSFVRALIGDDDAVGIRITKDADPSDPGARWFEIVGVVEDVRHHDLAHSGDPEIYFPVAQNPFPWATFVVRTRGDPSTLAAPLREAIGRIDPELPVFNVLTMNDVVFGSAARSQLLTSLLGCFAAVALALAGTGVFSVVSFSVSRRVREVAIRMAVGASKLEVVGLVMRQGLLPAVGGAALGMAGGVALTRLLAGELYGVPTHDPVSHVTAGLLMIAVATLATWMPALRATRVEPMTVLRAE